MAFFVFAKVGKGRLSLKKFGRIKKALSIVVCFGIIQNQIDSQKTSKCGKNISDTLGYHLMCHFLFLFLPHFDVICDLLLNRRMATWDLFVKHTCGSVPVVMVLR